MSGCLHLGRLDYSRPSNINTGTASMYESYRYPEVFTLDVGRSDLDIAVAGSSDPKTYLFSPFPIPIPLIPWPQGIVEALFEPPDYEVSRLGIELWIIPKSGDIHFDPRKVTVHRSDGKQFSPISQDGPGLLHETQSNRLPLLCALNLVLGQNDVLGHVAERELIITKPICLRLGFRTSAVPAEPYVLVIDGLTKDGEVVTLPSLEFQKASQIRFWRAP